MLRNLKLKTKIFFIPFLAGIILLTIFITAGLIKTQNDKLLNSIRTEYLPVQVFNSELKSILQEMNSVVEHAALTRNKVLAKQADIIHQQFIAELSRAESDPVIKLSLMPDKNEYDSFSSAFLDVVDKISSGSSKNLINRSLQKLKPMHDTLNSIIQKNIVREKRNVSQAFSSIGSKNRLLIILIGFIIFIGLAMSMVLSIAVIKSVMEPLDIVVNVAEQVADGQLTIDIPETEGTDEMSSLLRTFRRMVISLREMAVQIKEASNALASSAGQISTSVTQIASAAAETASAATETNTTVEEVRQTAIDSNKKAKHVSESAQKSVKISQAGEKTVAETIEEMQRIEEQMESIAESIMRLSEHGQAISSIITTVEDVAEQSRLLAVNASIEAVKAGEQGKGFAVVAQEVRTLAEQSKQATNRIRAILDEIQKSTSEAVMKTEQGTKAVKSGVEQSAKSGETIQRLANSVTEAAQATTQIAVSSQEQTVGMDQVVSAMESIKQASNQNVSATKQVEAAAQDLYNLGQTLMDIVKLYKL